MAVRFFSEDIQFGLKHKRVLSKWISEVVSSYRFTCGNINFVFVDNPKILEINIQYLQHNYFTDIITFNYNEDDCINGDIYISIDTVRENAKIYSSSFLSELYRVIIHGILHLVGLSDSSDSEKSFMRNAEDKALEILDSKLLLK